jgi:hypothetical protein
MNNIIDIIFRFKHGYLWYLHGIFDTALVISVVYFIYASLQ